MIMGHLVLRIEHGQIIQIGDDITVSLMRSGRRGGHARLAVVAPRHLAVIRLDKDGKRITGPLKNGRDEKA